MRYLVKLAMLATLLVVSIHGAPSMAEENPMTGRLTIVWGDSLEQEGSDHLRFLFTLDQATAPIEVDLHPGLLQGGLERWNGSRVTLYPETGIAEQNLRGAPLRVRALSLLKSAEGGSGTEVFGNQPWISVLCKFADKTAEPRTAAFIEEMFGNEPGQMDHYWRELSDGHIDLAGSAAAGWYTMARNHTDYVPTPGSGINADLLGLANDCLVASDPFVDFSNGGDPFVGINFLFNDILDCCAYGGGIEGEIDGVNQVWRATWQPALGGPNAAVLAHEIGHGFGLPHGNNFDADVDPYDSPWDVMSGANRFAEPHPDYTHLGKHTSAYHKEYLGWVDAEKLFVAGASTDESLALDHAGLAAGTDYAMARIPISDTEWYTVEARFRSGDYDANLPGDAVIIRHIDTTRPEPAWVVDSDQPAADIGDTAGSMWTVGETFEDWVNGISVAVEEKTATGFRVHVFVGTLPTIFLDGFERGDTAAWSSATPE